MNRNNCRFCEIANGQIENDYDQIICEDDNFFLIASIGAFVEGWSLVVPKNHSCSMRDHYNSDEFMQFLDVVLPVYSKRNEKMIAFEHGANKENSLTSCGTSHAHLHLVPLKESLKEDIQKPGILWESSDFSSVHSYVRNEEYLLYFDLQANWRDSELLVHRLEKPHSQFFRKVIAEKYGYADQYDYKAHPNVENTIATKVNMSEAFALL